MSLSQPDPHDPFRPTGPNPIGVLLKSVLKPLASLQLTVVLLALGVGLVFFGTLAQKTAGMWTVVDKYFWSWIVMIDLQPTLEFLKIFFAFLVPDKQAVAPSWVHIPFPGGKLIGGLMFVNLLAAHALRFKFTWKRTGIIVAHSGLLLLFVGEAITRECQIEQRMTIPEGQAVNFTEDARAVEFAFTTPDADGTRRTTVIPGSMLARAAKTHTTISHPDLPVDVKVDSYMVNSSRLTPRQIALLKAEGKAVPENPVTAGLGQDFIVESAPEVSGVGEQTIDLPAAYVTLFRKGTDQKIGTYLVSLWFTFNPFDRETEQKQAVTVDGHDYDLALRYKRYYKPFSLYLRKFSFDRYTGTQNAKNYSSDLTLIDPERQQHRDVRVSMNDPMRYRGETFYQSNFDKTTEKTTVLQVVRNPGWQLPYLACVMVGTGLLFHFILGLVQYLRRQKNRTEPASAVEILGLWVAIFAVMACLVRFGLVANWLDGLLGPVGGGSILGSLAPFFIATAVIPAVGVYVLLNAYRGPRAAAVVQGERPTIFERFMPVAVVGLGALMLLAMAIPKPGKPDLETLARIPVVDGGRVKPLDTVARVYLRKISAREEFVGDDNKMHPAIEWIIDMMASPGPSGGPAWEYKVIRIENEQVQSLLGLTRREGYRYSFNEIFGKEADPKHTKLAELQYAMDKARPRDDAQKQQGEAKIDRARIEQLFESGDRDVFGAQVMETAERIELFMKLCNRAVPLTLPPAEGVEWRSLGEVQRKAEQQAVLAAFQSRGILPRDAGKLDKAQVDEIQAEIEDRMFDLIRADPSAMKLADVIFAYKSRGAIGQGDQERLTKALTAYREATESSVKPADRSKADFEVFLNEFAPAYQVIILYGFAGMLALWGWVAIAFRPALAQALQKSAFWLLVTTFVVHGFALFARMYLMDRPLVFITNLYSTAVFIGWAAVGLGLCLERIAPIGLGNLAAAVVGGGTAIIAHNLAASGDTLEMMQAVLDTNFWLATHVTTINAGYAATYVAGVIGVLYILIGLFTPLLTRTVGVGAAGGTSRGDSVGRVFGQLMYGVLCLATLLSFVGTVLGGIWADQSWGRFWGWDPKENGAVLIVIWNALILHARWCGLVKDRGVAVLTLVGNMITTWSYFGTNQLGVGLHAYGFSNTLATGCMVTWVGHTFLIGFGMIPLRYWRSFADQAQPRSEAVAVPVSVPIEGPTLPVTALPEPPPANGTNGAHPNGNHPNPGKGKKQGKKR
ncbi:MAG: cytochrome c biogenesis protein ResB [Planctomycetes bacterium]|nr:cytochrome c biogenesis protein ResB [Planctomycetota bacterium]